MTAAETSILGLLILLVLIQPAHNSVFDSGVQFACANEVLSASCQEPDHVIVAQWAFYGRLQYGNCIQTNYGSKGCGTDVLRQLDGQCSGRPACSFETEEKLRDDDCPHELKRYLEYQYQCWPVVNYADHVCRTDQPIQLQQPSGYLSSYVTTESGRGSPSCPWLIKAQQGQRLNITLINFAWADNKCFQFAVIKEGERTTPITECDSSSRETVAYVSHSNTIQLHMLAYQNQDQHFLIHFQPLGCPDPVVGSNLWARRQGDVATVTCNHTGDSWPLRCSNHQWIGAVGNCSHAQNENWQVQSFFTGRNFPYGILVIVAIGVALGVFLGGLLLVCVSRYFKRRRRMDQFSDPEEYQPDLFPGSTDHAKFPGPSMVEHEPHVKSLRHSPTSPHYEGTRCSFSTAPEHSCKDCQCPFGYGSLPPTGLHHTVSGATPTLARHMYESPRADQQRRLNNS